MITSKLPAPADDILIFVCGPEPMLRHISGGKGENYTQGPLAGLLKELGYTEEMVYKF